MPRWKPLLEPVVQGYTEFCNYLDTAFASLSSLKDDGSQFAAKAKAYGEFSFVLFGLQKDTTCSNAAQWLAQQERKKCIKYYWSYRYGCPKYEVCRLQIDSRKEIILAIQWFGKPLNLLSQY
jgi:hypothetical protein